MEERNDIIKRLRRLIETVANEFELRLAMLFGSVARGKIRPDSDIDIAIACSLPLFEEPNLHGDFLAVFESAEIEFGREIDFVPISSRNILLLKRILKEGILLYEHKSQYYNIQRLHWRFLVEDNHKYTLNYSTILSRKLEML